MNEGQRSWGGREGSREEGVDAKSFQVSVIPGSLASVTQKHRIILFPLGSLTLHAAVYSNLSANILFLASLIYISFLIFL